MRVCGRVGGVLLSACLSTFVVNANSSAVSILIPPISADLRAPVELLQWAVTGYLLVGAAVIVTAGALGDVFGRRKLFVLGFGLFVVSCVIIALAGSGLTVVLGRLVQGAAGATLLASGLSLLSVNSSGTAQLKSVSLWGASAAAGAAAGPVVGGVLNDTTGWQGLFWIDAAIAVACVPLVLRAVPESRDPSRPRTIDLAGTVLIAAALVPFVLAMTNGSAWGWLSLPTLACLLGSVLSVVGFVVIERRVRAPLLDLRLLRNAALVGSTGAILIGAGAIAALSFLVSLYFQEPSTLDLTSLQAGLATLPVAAAVVVIAPLVAPLAHHFGSRPVIVTGFVILTASFGALATVRPSWNYGMFVLPLLGVAIGLALSNSPASSIATAAVAPEEVGAASGISNMARYVGGAVMTAVVAGLYARITDRGRGKGDPLPDALATAFSAASIALAAFSAAGVVLALLVARRPPAPNLADFAAAASSTTHTLPPTGRNRPSRREARRRKQ